MKFSLSRKFRVLFAFLLTAPLTFGIFSTPVHASNTAQLNVAPIIALANADRAANGVPALTEDTLLDSAAQEKANDMAAKGYFSHIGPDGAMPWYWFKAAGYYYYDAGENLAQGFSNPITLENAWMHSPKHRENLLDPVYSRVGIGLAHGMYQGYPTTYVVQFFANPYLGNGSTIAKAAKSGNSGTRRNVSGPIALLDRRK